MRRLARWCFRHRYLVPVLWIVILVVLVGITKNAGTDYTDGFTLPGTDSAQAQLLLANGDQHPGSGDDTIVIHTLNDKQHVTDPSIQAAVQSNLERAAAAPFVAHIQGPFAVGAQDQTSANKRTAYAVVSFTAPDQNLTQADITPFVTTVSGLRGPSLQVEFGGGGFQTLKGSPVSGSVAIGLAAAAVVLMLAFGSLLATLIPLLAAICAVGAGVETVGLLSHALSVNSLTPSVAALIGIGVAVDYALFVVTRQRSGLRSGLGPEEAAVTALATSGRAVVFAGATVAIAMLGLLVLGVDFLTGVGLAAAITVGFAVAAAVTLLPALFGILEMRVLSRRERGQISTRDTPLSRDSGWTRWAALVQRRRALLSTGALVVMVVLLIPAFSIRLGSSDQGNDPASSTTRKAYDLLAAGFGAGYNGPLLVVGSTNDQATRSAFGTLAATIGATAGVASVAADQTAADSTVGVLVVTPTTSPQSPQTASLITDLRNTIIPAAERGTSLRVYVGGQTAVFQDFATVLGSKLPLFLTVVILLGCILLMIAFRSVVIPLTAAAMNVLAGGASFGIVVAVFQWGWGSNAIGLGAPGPIESFLPVMLIAILFGLSMDYQVFLVSRIQEEWLRTKDNAGAVGRGQAATGRVITAAAAIMVFVFLAFVLEGRRPIGEFGLGLAVAILLDALLLRTILVPAAMHLFGTRNWWLPNWLNRALPHVGLEAADAASPPISLGDNLYGGIARGID